MTERVDAVMEAMQATRLDTASDRTRPEPRIHELLPREDAVLLASQSGQLPLAPSERASAATGPTCRSSSTHTGT